MKVNAVFNFEFGGEKHTGTLVIRDGEGSGNECLNDVFGREGYQGSDECEDLISTNLREKFSGNCCECEKFKMCGTLKRAEECHNIDKSVFSCRDFKKERVTCNNCIYLKTGEFEFPYCNYHKERLKDFYGCYCGNKKFL